MKKHVKIDSDLHDLLKFKCFMEGVTIDLYVGRVLRKELEGVKEWRDKVRELKG